MSKEGVWIWMNSDSVIEFSAWGPKEPDNVGGQDCLTLCGTLWTGYLWDDKSCNGEEWGIQKHLCQKS